jgi:LmbE family N-acetylglucosaminyl deacetylase
MRILVLVAHPDDEVLGGGGTIAKYAEKGDRIYVSFLGEGLFSRGNLIRGKSKPGALKELRRASEKAAGILGIESVSFGNFPDNSFDTVPLLKIVKHIERDMERVQPEILFTHFYGDLNIDHRLSFEASITAARPIDAKTLSRILCFETLSSTEWQAPIAGRGFNPNVFEDISGFIDKKKEALKAYRSEIRVYPHPRSLEGCEITARKWGMKAGLVMAEAFWLVREVNSLKKN